MPAYRVTVVIDYIEADETEAKEAVLSGLYDLDAHNNTLAIEVKDIEQLEDGE